MWQERCGVVYALRHNPTGKIYVGSTLNVDERIQQHILALRNNRHNVPNMQNDYNKFGEDYSVCILQDHLLPDALRTKFEHLYMTILGTRDPEKGYNYLDITNDFDLSKKNFHPVFPKTNRTRIQRERVKRNITAAELARIIGVTRQAVSRWEIGLSKPNVSTQKKLADYFGVTVDELLSADNPQN